ncbi:MAG: hypothetical protein AAB383_05530 [Patescibacteria group bacterium]
MPVQATESEPTPATLGLLILLEANVGHRGPLDSLTKFVEIYGSEQANVDYAANRPHEIRGEKPELTPSEKPVDLQAVSAHIKLLLRTWVGLT